MEASLSRSATAVRRCKQRLRNLLMRKDYVQLLLQRRHDPAVLPLDQEPLKDMVEEEDMACLDLDPAAHPLALEEYAWPVLADLLSLIVARVREEEARILDLYGKAARRGVPVNILDRAVGSSRMSHDAGNRDH